MTEEPLRKDIHHAMESRLSGVREDPRLAQRVIAASKGEKPVKKKLSVSIVLAVVLILLGSAALAAGLGLFGTMADRYGRTEQERLTELDQVAERVGAAIVTGDGISVTIDQCYYEGNRVFISYRASGNLYSTELHEGHAPEDTVWDYEDRDIVCSENFTSDNLQAKKTLEYLDGSTSRWAKEFHAALHDGLMLTDGTYLDIIGGGEEWQEDGSVIGWKECEVPNEKLADTLECKAVLFRGTSITAQDENGYHHANTRGEQTDIPFTVKKNDQLEYLSGTSANDVYHVAADFTAGKIDLKGTIRLQCPSDWVKAHDDWDYHAADDLIEDFLIYQDDQPIANHGTESERYAEETVIFFEQLYARPESLDGMKLVPIYTQSGPHMDEAIPLRRPVNR